MILKKRKEKKRKEKKRKEKKRKEKGYKVFYGLQLSVRECLK
ncbi:hypothetical protein [Entomobacter blattae]|nr:hypothetical protein [Entomobacter blattae]